MSENLTSPQGCGWRYRLSKLEKSWSVGIWPLSWPNHMVKCWPF